QYPATIHPVASYPSRCPSTHPAQPTNNQPKMIPPTASATRVGGGGLKSEPTYDSTSTAMSDQKPYVPVRSRARVAVAYSHTPATNITPSTATVPVTEFHSPSPSGVPPGYSGMSGRWVT